MDTVPESEDPALRWVENAYSPVVIPIADELHQLKKYDPAFNRPSLKRLRRQTTQEKCMHTSMASSAEWQQAC
jgi:hypothetical protein